LSRRSAVPDLKASATDAAGLQIGALRDLEVDPNRRIAAELGIDRAVRFRARLLEQRGGEVIDTGANLHERASTALTRIGIDRVHHDRIEAVLLSVSGT
jgi:hypothetical protein